MTHWPTKSLGSFCQTGSGATPSRGKPEYFDNGTVPWVKSGELKDPVVLKAAESITVAATKETNAHIVPKNAVLIAMYGATVGDTAILGIDAATNQAICHIIPDPDTAHFRFVWYALKNSLDEFLSKRVGGAQPNISQKIIRDTLIPVPPLAEQERMVKLLDEADALRKLRTDADRRTVGLIPALFDEMFGESVVREKGWRICPLGELIVDGPQNGLYKHSSFYGEGTPILRIDAFYDGELEDVAALKRLRTTPEETERYRLREHDIVINRVNSPEYLGKSAIIPTLPEAAVFESNMMRFRVSTELVDPGYLICFLQTPVVKRHILGRAKHSINQSSINQEDVKSLLVPVPPLLLQSELSRRVAEIRELEADQTTCRVRLDALFQSMLHRAFAGEI